MRKLVIVVLFASLLCVGCAKLLEGFTSILYAELKEENVKLDKIILVLEKIEKNTEK